MAWRPSREPDRYDRARVTRLAPIRAAVDALGLPLRRKRKLAGMLNAIEMQIEDGGDSPEVNTLLLDALRVGVRHQVDEPAAQAVLRAIDAFAAAEAQRWAHLRAGTLSPIERAPEEQLDDLMQEGYRLQQAGHTAAACDRWMAAWNLVRQLARVEMRTSFSFGRVYGTFQSVYNWSVDLAYELGNAGVDNPIYYEQLLRFTREYLALFPDEEPDRVLSLLRAQGEALWFLGRQTEAEQVYAGLVERLPDEGWGYIGWADHYWMYRDSPQDYAAAVAILQRALARPKLRDREYVLEAWRSSTVDGANRRSRLRSSHNSSSANHGERFSLQRQVWRRNSRRHRRKSRAATIPAGVGAGASTSSVTSVRILRRAVAGRETVG